MNPDHDPTRRPRTYFDDGPVSVEVKKRVKIANRIVGWVIIVLVAVGTSAAMVKILRILGLIS